MVYSNINSLDFQILKLVILSFKFKKKADKK